VAVALCGAPVIVAAVAGRQGREENLGMVKDIVNVSPVVHVLFAKICVKPVHHSIETANVAEVPNVKTKVYCCPGIKHWSPQQPSNDISVAFIVI